MRKRTPSEIKAYGDGYAEAYKQFQYLIEKHEISTAVCKMKIFADAVALTVETATDTADTSQSCFNCDHYEPKGWCNLFKNTVFPNYKCCSEFAEIKPYEYEIKALYKEHKEPYCEIEDCDYHKYCKERGQTDCPWK